MRAQKSMLIAVTWLFLGFITVISLAQEVQDEFLTGEVGAGAKLVVTWVTGPTTAIHNQTITVIHTVKNQGTTTSGVYQVGLYLSTDKTIDPAADRLLKNETVHTNLQPGQSIKVFSKVLVPINGLSGDYYYGAVVSGSKKASSKQVSLTRYSLADNNETVADHKTGLIWQRVDDGIKRNWDAADQYCGDLALGGRADWRLPRMDDLQTIVDYSRFGPTINPVFDYRADFYWSASSLPGGLNAWVASFYDGDAGWSGKTSTYYVRCVRGGP